jgi:hypothetical protein
MRRVSHSTHPIPVHSLIRLASSGLVSQELASHCKRIVGVDISTAMVDQFNLQVSLPSYSPRPALIYFPRRYQIKALMRLRWSLSSVTLSSTKNPSSMENSSTS